MRQITTKYAGECRKCGATIPAGSLAVYERRVGIFCPNCAPTDTEEIRELRQEAADRKADRLEEWAARRRARAAAVFESHRPMTSDYAFNTQPGHIPLRARIIRQENREFESLQVAERLECKAERLRHVRVAGDAERSRDARREATRQWIRPGMLVETFIYGPAHVLKVNQKTATVATTRSGFKTTVDLSFLRSLEPKAPPTDAVAKPEA